MTRKTMYLVMCVVGLVLPYWQFVPWVAAHGLNLRLFVEQMFANRISGFFVLDVLVSAVVLFMCIGVEAKRLGEGGWWLPRVAILLVGVSLGLPLFLYMRERRLEEVRGGVRVAAPIA
jgi:hypothetical protein